MSYLFAQSKIRTLKCLAALLTLALTGCAAHGNAPGAHFWMLASIFDGGDQPDVVKTVGHIAHPALEECSGMELSEHHCGVLWMHNDSGDDPYLYPVTLSGDPLANEGEDRLPWVKLRVAGAVHRDWEDLAADGQGNLIIADVGNNANERRDLTLYWIREPQALRAGEVRPWRTVGVYFPEQTEFPPAKKNFDCEAMVARGNEVFLLTKHRGDERTVLYRVPEAVDGARVPLQLVAEFEIGGQVTAADLGPSGELAVLCFNGLWIFEAPAKGSHWLASPARHLGWKFADLRQCEAVVFRDAETLLIANEQRDIYELKVSDVPPVGRIE